MNFMFACAYVSYRTDYSRFRAHADVYAKHTYAEYTLKRSKNEIIEIGKIANFFYNCNPVVRLCCGGSWWSF